MQCEGFVFERDSISSALPQNGKLQTFLLLLVLGQFFYLLDDVIIGTLHLG